MIRARTPWFLKILPSFIFPSHLLCHCVFVFGPSVSFRVREVLAVKMVVEKFSPFSVFSTGTTWQELVGVVAGKETPFPQITPRHVKHLLVEMYVATKKVSVEYSGNQATAAEIERDFSACGNLLTKSRSRMGTFWVELVMFCKANFDLIPAFKNIPIIAAKDIRKCLPACFKGDNTDLFAAEAAFDVLNNTAIPTEDDIDLDG